MSKIVCITGATAGIGEATAEIFAKHQHDLIITGRRKDRLEALSKKLTSRYQIKIHTLCFDVRHQEEVERAFKSLPQEFFDIDVLVNNAGLAVGLDKIQDGDFNDWDVMIDTNIKGLLYVSQAVIPLLKRKNGGHIINIGSTAAKTVYQKGNVYCATKFAVNALSQTMRIDLLEHCIKVTQVSPGAANTEFSTVRFKGDVEKADAVYNGYQPLTAIDVAENIYYVTTLPKHVCINELEITALAQANSTHIHK